MQNSERPMVRVEWIDSGYALFDGWEDRQALINRSRLDMMGVVTVGFLIHEDDERIIIALSFAAENDHYVSAQQIWKPSITKVTYLEGKH